MPSSIYSMKQSPDWFLTQFFPHLTLPLTLNHSESTYGMYRDVEAPQKNNQKLF